MANDADQPAGAGDDEPLSGDSSNDDADGELNDPPSAGEDDAVDGPTGDGESQGEQDEESSQANAAIRGEFARAQNLAMQAGDLSRPLDERVADLEEAAAILKNLREHYPEAQWPVPDLPLRIAELERRGRRIQFEAQIDG